MNYDPLLFTLYNLQRKKKTRKTTSSKLLPFLMSKACDSKS